MGEGGSDGRSKAVKEGEKVSINTPTCTCF